MLEDCDLGGEIHTDRIKMLENCDLGGKIHTERTKVFSESL